MSNRSNATLEKCFQSIDMEVAKGQELKKKSDELMKRVNIKHEADLPELDAETQMLADAFKEKIQEVIKPAQEMLSQVELISNKNSKSSQSAPSQRIKIPI